MIASRPARPDPASVLEDRGYRLTGPRRSVIRLMDQKEEGFSAEDICEGLPEVGRATVYRTIVIWSTRLVRIATTIRSRMIANRTAMRTMFRMIAMWIQPIRTATV